MIDKSNLKKLPNRSNHNCFACSPINSKGLRMEFYTDEKSVMSWVTVPEHLCGWNQLVHGGVISTMLDEVMSWSAIYLLKKIILTKSITVDFIKPIYINRELFVKGSVVEVKFDRQAIMEGFIYIENTLCAASKGTFVLLNPETAKRMGFVDDDVIRGMAPILGFTNDEPYSK